MEKLKRHILSAHSETGQKWLNRLPDLIQKCTELWQLEKIEEFNNLSWNYVALATSPGGIADRSVSKRTIVLKISFDIPSLMREINALKVFPPGSSVGLLEFDENLGAALLEAAVPGKPLLGQKDSIETLSICCDVAMRIKSSQRASNHAFECIADLFQNLDKTWDSLSPDFLQLARKLKNELLPNLSDIYVIHGDLHRENILSHGSGWKAIDPKGYKGSIYNEIWPFIHEPITEIPYVAKRLGLDESLLFKWSFMHSILATTWGIEDGIDTKNILGLGEKIFPLLK